MLPRVCEADRSQPILYTSGACRRFHPRPVEADFGSSGPAGSGRINQISFRIAVIHNSSDSAENLEFFFLEILSFRTQNRCRGRSRRAKEGPVGEGSVPNAVGGGQRRTVDRTFEFADHENPAGKVGSESFVASLGHKEGVLST